MRIYLAIAALSLYGDLPKRVIGAAAASFTTYAIFGLIIGACFTKAYAPEARSVRPGDNWFSIVCLALIGVYLIQLLTNFKAPLFEATGSALYIILPLTYLVTIAQCFPQFDLYRLGQAFQVLMLPIVVVALIQYFVDDTFLIDTTYDEMGGIVARNFIDFDASGWDPYYKRFPSLLASADRLSAMGMMQLYFCVLALRASSSRMTTRRALWLLFSLASAIAVLMIAGARSRILIVGVAIALAGLPMLQNLVTRARQKQRSAGVSPIIIIMIFAAIGGSVLAAGMVGGMEGALDSLPIIRQLNATVEKGDVWVRAMEYFTVSSMPGDVTLFGLGLGVAGVGGRPGEIAIRAMWIESGVFWTALMLLMYAALVLRLAQCLAGAIWRQAPYDIFLCAMPLLTWVLGLMAGLAGVFEASTALTLFPAVAVITAGVTVSPVRSHVYAAGLWGGC